MSREYGRNQRVADLVQREVASIIQREGLSREAGLITVSFVDVSPDLKNARIYFTCLEPVLPEEAVVTLLNERAKHFRHMLAKVLPLRVIPELVFLFDHSIGRANRLSALIDSVNQPSSKT